MMVVRSSFAFWKHKRNANMIVRYSIVEMLLVVPSQSDFDTKRLTKIYMWGLDDPTTRVSGCYIEVHTFVSHCMCVHLRNLHVNQVVIQGGDNSKRVL
jgi:hypothetical protein